jgi:hypothetical protein
MPKHLDHYILWYKNWSPGFYLKKYYNGSCVTLQVIEYKSVKTAKNLHQRSCIFKVTAVCFRGDLDSARSALKAAGMWIIKLGKRFGGKRDEKIIGFVSFLDARAGCRERKLDTLHDVSF